MDGIAMEQRTRKQEQKYGQALGYGWGQKDAAKYMPPHSRPRRLNSQADVMSFATFFSVYEEKTGHHYTLEKAWDYFTELTLEEQAAYGVEWMLAPWSPFTAPGRTNA
jgi:hypothetical protein